MKSLFLTFILCFSSLSWAQGIELKGWISDHYEDPTLERVYFEGNIQELRKILNQYFYFQAEFSFEIKGENHDLKQLEEIALSMFEKIHPGVSVIAPQPCGYKLAGEIQHFQEDQNFKIQGLGDGGFDTCSGRGGPGAWEVSFEIKLNSDKKSGTLLTTWYEE